MSFAFFKADPRVQSICSSSLTGCLVLSCAEVCSGLGSRIYQIRLNGLRGQKKTDRQCLYRGAAPPKLLGGHLVPPGPPRTTAQISQKQKGAREMASCSCKHLQTIWRAQSRRQATRSGSGVLKRPHGVGPAQIMPPLRRTICSGRRLAHCGGAEPARMAQHLLVQTFALRRCICE